MKQLAHVCNTMPTSMVLRLWSFMILLDVVSPASLKFMKASDSIPPKMMRIIAGLGPHPSAVIPNPEVPPPAMKCKTAEECVKQKQRLTEKYCAYNPFAPACEELRECPPGGCGHGHCEKGYCKCDEGWEGSNCNKVTLHFPIHFDIDGFMASTSPPPGFAAPAPPPMGPIVAFSPAGHWQAGGGYIPPPAAAMPLHGWWAAAPAGPAPAPGLNGWGITYLIASVQAGALVLPVASHDGFSIGSQITIDPGTKVQEVNYITGFGSFLLKYPLRYPHAVWMKVVVSAAAPPAPAPRPV